MTNIDFKKTRNLGLIVIGLLALWLASSLYERSIPLATVTSTYFKKEFNHPWKQINHKGEMTYEFNYDYGGFNGSVLNMVPDDKLLSVKVNDKLVDFSSLSEKKLSNWRRGFDFNYKDYLKPGINNFKVEIFNKSGRGGLVVSEKLSSALLMFILLLYSLGISIILVVFLKKLKFSIPEISLFVLWAIIASWYLMYTPYNVRIFDVYEGGGHMDYIEILKNKLSFPNPGEGWEYHQPPLYYIFGAIVAAISESLLGIDYNESLRLFSTLIFGFFLIYACRIIAIVIRNEKLKLLMFSLVLFWPAGIIHASRVGNDGLMYLFCTAGLFHLVKWWYNKKPEHFYWCLAFLFLTLLSKSSGIILAGAIGGVLLTLIIRKGIRVNLKPALLTIAVIFVSMGINLGDNIYYASQEEGQDWLLVNVGNTLNKRLKVQNGFTNYVHFNIPIYVNEAYTSTWNDKGGRQYFWNFLLKSAMFSEFQFKSKLHKALALTMAYVLLFTLIFGVVLLFRKFKLKDLHKITPILWFVLASIIALMAYRIKVPVSCNGDFRYIYPMIVGLVATYGYLLNKQFWKKAGYLSIGLAIVMCLSSIVFFVSWAFVGT